MFSYYLHPTNLQRKYLIPEPEPRSNPNPDQNS